MWDKIVFSKHKDRGSKLESSVPNSFIAYFTPSIETSISSDQIPFMYIMPPEKSMPKIFSERIMPPNKSMPKVFSERKSFNTILLSNTKVSSSSLS